MSIQLFFIGGITAYLLYINMHKDNAPTVTHDKNFNNITGISNIVENNVDITSTKKQIKEHVPYIADERPVIAKPIAIPMPDIKRMPNIKFNSTHGWINYDLLHQLDYKMPVPIYTVFNKPSYI